MDTTADETAALAAQIAAAKAAALSAFWGKVLNGTPPYCKPQNTLPLLTDPSKASSWVSVEEVTALLPIAFMALGLVTNLVFLFVISRARTMRSGINFYLGNLAVIDILYLTVVGGVYLDRLVAKPAVFHETIIGCYFESAADALSFYVCIGMITMGTVYHLCSRMSNGFAEGKSGTSKVTVIIWLLAIGLGILSAIQWGKMFLICLLWPRMPEFSALPFTYTMCGPGPIDDEHYGLYLDLAKTGTFAVALFINVVLYAMICTKSSPDDLDRHVNAQVYRLLVCNGIVFFLCQTVNRALNIIYSLQEFSDAEILDDTQEIMVKIIGNACLYLNPAIRPLIYVCCSGVYRRAFRNALTGRCDDEGGVQNDALSNGNEHKLSNM